MLKPKEIQASKVERLQRELGECAQQSEELFQAAHSAYMQCKALLQK